jgi:hypothetical protein
MKNILFASLLLFFAFCLPVWGQEHDLEFGGGYQHSTGDQGLDGFTVGIGWNPIPSAQLYLNYDGLFDHSTLGSFALTQTGLTTVHSHMQGLLTGPRIFLPGLIKGHGQVKGHVLVPFFDAGFGEAHLHTDLTQANIGSSSASDTAFVWALGGGADFRVYPHVTVRGNLGLLRTHFASSGQSRLRFGVTVLWSLRSRAH